MVDLRELGREVQLHAARPERRPHGVTRHTAAVGGEPHHAAHPRAITLGLDPRLGDRLRRGEESLYARDLGRVGRDVHRAERLAVAVVEPQSDRLVGREQVLEDVRVQSHAAGLDEERHLAYRLVELEARRGRRGLRVRPLEELERAEVEHREGADVNRH